MSEPPTIEQYQRFIQERNFHVYKCKSCGALIVPPKGACYSCGGTEMEWAKVSGNGTLISFTVIHIASVEFQDEVPYILGIVELEEGPRITTRLTGFDPNKPEEIQIGAKLKMGYEVGKTGKTYLTFSPI